MISSRYWIDAGSRNLSFALAKLGAHHFCTRDNNAVTASHRYHARNPGLTSASLAAAASAVDGACSLRVCAQRTPAHPPGISEGSSDANQRRQRHPVPRMGAIALAEAASVPARNGDVSSDS
jgi:hypothetical protein